MTESTYLTPEETAAMMRVNVQTIWKWVRTKKLSCKRYGRVIRISLQNISDFNASSKEAYQ